MILNMSLRTGGEIYQGASVLMETKGEAFAERFIVDQTGALHRVLSRLLYSEQEGLFRHRYEVSDKCLPFIDLNDVTVFNQLQAGVLLAEWHHVETQVQAAEEEEVVGRARSLIERCLREPDSYVLFDAS